jgi:fibronectin type 3 domain-containing protein
VPPTDLNIPSPTNAPDLTWTGVENADSYNIYSNNILIGSTTSTTYTDNNPVVGTDTYYVTAVNLAGESGPSNKVTVTVENIKPTITSPSSYVINARAMLNFTITTTGYPTPVISWSTTSGSLPPGLSFKDNGDGTATLSGQVPTQNQGYYFITFTASNSAGSTNQQFLLTTTDYNEPVTFLNVNNITETYNVPFSFTIDTTGVPVPTISKLAGSGSLPTGVTLVNNKDGTATLSGNLDNASDYGVFTFTIKASNSSGTVYQVFTITIDKGTTLKNIANQTASVGTTFSMGISTTGFPEPTFTASNLPNGLSIQNNGDSTATISGTPAVGSGGSYQVTVTAYNSFGTDAQTFTLKVDEGPSITSANTATATRGQAFSFQVTATGFPAPTYALTGTLPKGITFNSNTGLFSGTPKATDAPGTYQFTITATNSTGPATQNFTLILN